MTKIHSLFELATELRDKGQLNDAVGVLTMILQRYPTDEKLYGVHSILAGIYRDLGQHDKALDHFQKATDLNPESELASLGLYATLHELDRHPDAIKELIRYLKVHPARLYKDTLEELLSGLMKGFMTDFQDDIRNLAKLNGLNV